MERITTTSSQKGVFLFIMEYSSPPITSSYPLPTIFSFFSLPVKHEMGCLANDLFTSRSSLHLFLCERDDSYFFPPPSSSPSEGGGKGWGCSPPTPLPQGSRELPLFRKEGLGEILKIPLHPPFPKGENRGIWERGGDMGKG